MDKTLAIGSILRHALTTGGGYLVSSGLLAESDVEPLVGGLMVLVGIVWSLIQKRRSQA
jgi:hypothetical protein